MSSGLKRTGRRSDATPFAGGRLPQFATVRQLDLDAARYLAAVEAADGARLEPAVRAAVNAFVVGCKADSIWTPIKASCILAGARTLSGGLVPLAGTAPTNFNFVSGDYNRKTGLVGNGTTKYLNTNRNNNADPQNSQHGAVYVTSAGTPSTSDQVYLGSRPASGEATSNINIGITASSLFFRNRSSSIATSGTSAATGLIGCSRAASASYTTRASATNATVSSTSAAPNDITIEVFRHTAGPLYGNPRIAFYSIGESVDLALLDTRVTTLINAISAAIQ